MLDSSGVAIATVHSILVLVDVVGNSLVCAIVYKNQDMRIPINYLLANLAVTDILYATFITPDTFLRLWSTHPDGTTGTVLCKLLTGGNVAWIAAGSSVVTLVAIAIERYYKVIHPLDNKGKLTKRKIKMIIFGSWIFGLILVIQHFIVANVKDDSCDSLRPGEWMSKAYVCVWFVSIALSVMLMAGLYTRIVFTLWFKRNNDNQLTYQNRGVLRVRKRVTLMVITVTALFGICWLTDSVLHLIDMYTTYTIDTVVYTVAHVMVLLTSAVNPFLYCLINKNFRVKIKKMMCCNAGSWAVKESSTENLDGVELANVTTSTKGSEACSKEY